MEKWDEISIEIESMGNLISRLINKILKKKLKRDVKVQLNTLSVTDMTEKLYVHLNIDAEINMDDAKELLRHFKVI